MNGFYTVTEKVSAIDMEYFILRELTPSEALYIKSHQNALHPILVCLHSSFK